MFWAFVVFGLLLLPAPIQAQTHGNPTRPSHSEQLEVEQRPSSTGVTSRMDNHRPALVTRTLRRPLESWNTMRRRLALLRMDTNSLHGRDVRAAEPTTMLPAHFRHRLHVHSNKYTRFLLAGGVITAASVAWWMWDVVSSPSVVATDTDNTLLVQPILERRTIGLSSMFLF